MIVGGKYVPPHMRTTGSSLEPCAMPATSNKKPISPFAKWSKSENTKPSKKQPIKKQEKKTTAEKKSFSEDSPIAKPHCELFLADLPPALRSLQSLAGFFHPYGEISNIQFIPTGKQFPADITQRELIEPAKFAKTNCAIIEFLTARVAKFVVGVLRKRVEALNFRIGLLKPGLADEMDMQEQRLLDSLHLPTIQINKTQSSFLNEANSTSQYSSEELSEHESRPTKRFIKPLQMADQAYFTGSSGTTSDSDFGRYDTSDDDTDLLTLALKNGIKVIRD